MVQEDANKLSKRAKRRAEGEASSEALPIEQGEGLEAEEEGGEGTAEDEAAPEEEAGAAAANRQARRAAAAKARARRKQERVEASAIGLDAGEMVDDALVRFTDKVSRLFRRYWNVLQWVIGLGAIGWFGYQVYDWRKNVTNARVSDALYDGVVAELGVIGDPEEQGKPNANGIVDPTPIFENDAARSQAALAAYEKAASMHPGRVAEGFARVGRAGVSLELGKLDEARLEYDAVLASSAIEKSSELKGAALEGKGLTLEAKGELPAALEAFQQLSAVPGFEERALYQQARIKHAQGDVAAVKELLNKLFKALGPPKMANLGGLPHRPEFIRERAIQLASAVDPLEKDVQIPKPPTGPAAVEQMLEQLRQSGMVTAPAPAEPEPATP